VQDGVFQDRIHEIANLMDFHVISCRNLKER